MPKLFKSKHPPWVAQSVTKIGTPYPVVGTPWYIAARTYAGSTAANGMFVKFSWKTQSGWAFSATFDGSAVTEHQMVSTWVPEGGGGFAGYAWVYITTKTATPAVLRIESGGVTTELTLSEPE